MANAFSVKSIVVRLGAALALGATLLAAPGVASAQKTCSCNITCSNGSSCSASGSSGCNCNCNPATGNASCSTASSVVAGNWPIDLVAAIANADAIGLAGDITGQGGGDPALDNLAQHLLVAGVAFDKGEAGVFYEEIESVQDVLYTLDQPTIDLVYTLALNHAQK